MTSARRSSSAIPTISSCRPGDAPIARAGGLHRFIGWDRPILTDSGGYQIFSLAERRRITEEGAEFRSHLDGSLHLLTPERAADIQAPARLRHRDGARRVHRDAGRRTATRAPRWSVRCAGRPGRGSGWRRLLGRRGLAAGGDASPIPGQAQFGIIQGGVHPHLRTESVQATTGIGFEAYAIGGLSVGEPPEVTYDIVGHTAPQLPEDRPRYLMGSGMPDDLIECVARGIDLFDCVLPTRNARNGQLHHPHWSDLDQERPLCRRSAPLPIPECGCYTCRHFSRAYLRHLYVAGEMAAATLNTLHNLYFYLDTMRADQGGYNVRHV